MKQQNAIPEQEESLPRTTSLSRLKGQTVGVRTFQRNFLNGLVGATSDDIGIHRPRVKTGFPKPTLSGFCHLVWEKPLEGGHGKVPKIYLGSADAAFKENFQTLQQAGVGGIVNCTKEIPCYFRKDGIKYAQVAINDVVAADLLPYLPGATAFMRACLSQWHVSVLVHCMAGVSRSASVVLAYLIEYEGMSLDEAFKTVKARRPHIHPNDGFWAQLAAYEKRCRLREQREQQKDEPSGTDVPCKSLSYAMNRSDRNIDKDWAKFSSAMYSACRDIDLPGDSFAQACFGKLRDRTVSLGDSEVDQILNVVLDYIWGRGVLSVEADWLSDICFVLDDERNKRNVPGGPAASRVIAILKDPNSDFCLSWTGEIYEFQLGRVFEALESSPSGSNGEELSIKS